MRTDLFGNEVSTEVLPPESCDSGLLCAWDDWRRVWRWARHGDTLPAAERRQVAALLDAAAIEVIKAPARTLEGARAKLGLALSSGPDAEMFGRHFAGGEKLPRITPLADFASGLVLDALEAVEHLMAAGEPAAPARSH